MENFRILIFVATLTRVCITAITFDSPVIIPADKEMVVTAGNNFTLECKGKYPLTWSFPDNPLTKENYHAESRINSKEPTETDENYGVRLDLFNVSAMDVGSYYCLYNTTDENKDISLADLEERGEAKSTYLYVDAYTSHIPKPHINDPYNGRTVVGGKIHLECSIRLDIVVPFTIEWEYPNKNIEKGVIIKSNTTLQHVNGTNNFPQVLGKRLLDINNVTVEDEGIYICKLTVHGNNNTKTEKKTIKVLKKGSALIKLSDPSNKTKSTSKINKSLNIVVDIDSFPEPKIKWYDNQQKPIISSIKYDVKISNNQTQLQIKNIKMEDRGIYQVVGKAGANATSSLYFTIDVLSPPNVELDSEQFYLVGIKHNITCTAKGYPLPKIKWFHQECEDFLNYNASFQEINDFQINQLNDVTVEGILKMETKKSGILMCYAENAYGRLNISKEFYVTDIENGFNILDIDNSIAVGDNITLTCAASVFKYKNERLNWYKMPENKLIAEGKSNDITNYRHSTSYSNRLTLSIPNIQKENSGNYECRLENIYPGGAILGRQAKALNVTDIEYPKNFLTNLNNSVFPVDLGKPNVRFICKFSGNPLPKIRWYKNHMLFKPNDDRIKTSEDGTTLIFIYMMKGDEGKYSCIARNRVGTAEKYVELSLNYGGFDTAYIIIIVALLTISFTLIIIIITIDRLCVYCRTRSHHQILGV